MGVFLRIDVDLLAAFYLCIILSFALRRLDHQDAFNQMFFQFCVLIIAECFIEALTCLINHHPAPFYRVLSTVLHMILFLFPPVMTCYWFLISKMLTTQGNIRDIQFRGPLMIPILVNWLILLLTPFFNLVFYIDEAGVYHRGPLYLLVAAIGYFYLLMSFIVLIKRRKNLVSTDVRFLSIFCLLPMIGQLLQGFVYGVLLMFPCSALALSILYLYLQERMVQTDYMTGAWTRYSFEFCLASKLKSQQNTPFGVIYVDIDNLKSINDQFGHPEGDIAIRATVSTIKGTLRKGDSIARLGGDEFGIVLNLQTQAELDAVVERIGKAIERYNHSSNKPYHLSLSLGAELFFGLEHENVESIINRVDHLMYLKKQQKKQAQTDSLASSAPPMAE